MGFYGHHSVCRISFKLLQKVEEQHCLSMVKNFKREGGKRTFSLDSTTTTPTSSMLFPSPSEETNDVFIEQPKPQRRKSVKSRNNSITQGHELSSTNAQTTAGKSLPTNNKKRRIYIYLPDDILIDIIFSIDKVCQRFATTNFDFNQCGNII